MGMPSGGLKHLDRLGGCWGGMLHDDDLQAWRLAGAGLALLFLGDVADLLKRLRLPDSPLTMAAPVFPTRSEDCGMREARKTGETARVGAGTAGALPWRARGAAPHSSQEKKEAYGRSSSGDHSRVPRPVERAAAGASA